MPSSPHRYAAEPAGPPPRGASQHGRRRALPATPPTDDRVVARAHELTKDSQRLGTRHALGFHDRSPEPGVSGTVAVDDAEQRSTVAAAELGVVTTIPPASIGRSSALDQARAKLHSRRSAEFFRKREAL